MKKLYTREKLFGAFDLHSNNNYLAIINEEDNRIYKRKLPNSPDVILAELEPYKDNLVGIVVESTFNWYWLVDLLMDEGYQLHLANPAGIQKYKGLKHSDDNHDAFWLAHLLRLGILPEGYIYPKDERPIRDLLRKRGHLVRLRTSLINSLQGIISRNCGCKLSGNKIKAIKEDKVSPLLDGQDDISLSGTVSKETIDYLGRQIRKVENAVLGKVKLKEEFSKLLTMAGVGKILALTIMLETGSIGRFPKVGDFASYCRKVPSGWTSNGKKKGKGNAKNGNKYLAWAFSEASELSRRYDDHA
ncbi:MAG: transposase, partial [Desulfobulbaceae bacterium]|nr:transposase [Desulfobulbaceae bacterium]